VSDPARVLDMDLAGRHVAALDFDYPEVIDWPTREG
jgi:hypothetical protein